MRIIISPAKKMNVDTDSLRWRDLPMFLPKAEVLCDKLQAMELADLKKLWKCNDSIAALNYERLQNMDLSHHLTPAILAYEGIQYRYMAPGVFSDLEFDYVQEHLRILSGFYGMLRPFDGVTPYRLEMQAKLPIGGAADLYGYWGRSIADHLFSETSCVLNLASKEYSQCVSRYLPDHIQFITCVFGELQGSNVIEKGTLCKMARGEMVRFMAEHQIQNPSELRAFDRLNYSYSEERSKQNTYVFLQK